jgi:hypothetical protein
LYPKLGGITIQNPLRSAYVGVVFHFNNQNFVMIPSLSNDSRLVERSLG